MKQRLFPFALKIVRWFMVLCIMLWLFYLLMGALPATVAFLTGLEVKEGTNDRFNILEMTKQLAVWGWLAVCLLFMTNVARLFHALDWIVRTTPSHLQFVPWPWPWSQRIEGSDRFLERRGHEK